MAKPKTRSKQPRPERPEAKTRARAPEKDTPPKHANERLLNPPNPPHRSNGAAAEPLPTVPPVEGALENATTVLGGALGAGYAGARAVTATLAPDAMAGALLVCMPDEWTTDDEARGLIHRLSNDEAAIMLAWLATQWRDGYTAAVTDLRAGRRPLTELSQ